MLQAHYQERLLRFDHAYLYQTPSSASHLRECLKAGHRDLVQPSSARPLLYRFPRLCLRHPHAVALEEAVERQMREAWVAGEEVELLMKKAALGEVEEAEQEKK